MPPGKTRLQPRDTAPHFFENQHNNPVTTFKKQFIMKTKPLFLSLAILLTTSCTSQAQKSDPVRNQLKWDRLAAPSNADGEIDAVYFGYTRPDGKHFDLKTELTFPIEPDQFRGGGIYEKDINFDGIPDLQVSLGYISGFGSEIFDAWIWNTHKQQFVNVEGYAEIPNPEIDVANRRIMSYDRHDDEMEVAEYKWKDGMLVLTARHTEKVEKEGNDEADIHLMQAQALVGEWRWVDDGQLPSGIQLILSLDIEDRTLYCSEATIYGSTAAFDLDCSYMNGRLTLTDAFGLSDEMSSLFASLKLNERGDLYGTYECTVGENHSKGTVTLRKSDNE